MMGIHDPRSLLRHYGLRPRRSLGQNFLASSTAPARIAAQATIGPEDTVLEIGAGLGTLTLALAPQAGRVIAVETDPYLVEILRRELASHPHVTIVHGDILTLRPKELLASAPHSARPLWGEWRSHYLVVANLPYYITAAVMRHLMEAEIRPARMVVTVQREVAQRMVAVPGKMNLLAVSTQFYGRPRICFHLKRGAFYPAPAVDSTVVRIDLYEHLPFPVRDVAHFFRVVRGGFAQRRKQLRNTLASAFRLPPPAVAQALMAVGIVPTRRAETLSLSEWGGVAEAIQALLSSFQKAK